MSNTVVLLLVLVVLSCTMAIPAQGLMPFTRPLWEFDDRYRILEQTPLPFPRTNVEENLGQLALARADWKETLNAITLDIPGTKKEDIKIEVENRVLRVSGERKAETEQEGDKWHRVERTSGKFWRQFRLPYNADLDHIRAHLEDGVLRITAPKLAEEKKQTKVVDI